jgi:AcrR family transcriptional regulator
MVSTQRRRRLPVADRRHELIAACLHLIGTRPWDKVTMTEVARAAGVSKPLLYHYYATKGDLYLAAIRSAAEELRDATRPHPGLPIGLRLATALRAHVDWIDENALAYRAILQGGISSDADVQAIVEESRADAIARLTEAFQLGDLAPVQRIALRGWVGFLEAGSLEWLVARDITKERLAQLFTASVSAALLAADVDLKATDG